MANASAQFEDLLGDYINGGVTSVASSNHSFSGSPDFGSIYSAWSSGQVYLALSTDSSLDVRFDSFNELSGNGYNRVNTSSNSGSSSLEITGTSGTDGSWENEYDISFAQSTASWGTVYFAIFCYNDGSDDFPLIACPIGGGTMASPTGVSVGNNTTLTFSAGDLKYTIA